MDKKHRQIKKRVEELYSEVESINTILGDIRDNQCDHPECKFVTYSTGPGRYYKNTKVCAICGDLILDYKIE